MPISGEVLFEARRIGNSVKLTALHVDSLTEVTVVGHVGAGEQRLKALAIQKLEYVMAKKAAP
jgi:hypothetical protein